MHFDSREDYIRWATAIMLAASDRKTDNNAVGNALDAAQAAANLFWPLNARPQGRAQPDPYVDRPAVRNPPQVPVSGPSVPGERVNPNVEPRG